MQIPSGKIDWVGVKRVGVHLMLIGAGAIVMYLEQMVLHHDFGQYQVLVSGANTLVFTFFEKFFSTYNVTLQGSESQ